MLNTETRQQPDYLLQSDQPPVQEGVVPSESIVFLDTPVFNKSGETLGIVEKRQISSDGNEKKHGLRRLLTINENRLHFHEYPQVIVQVAKHAVNLRRETYTYSLPYTLQYWSAVGLRTGLIAGGAIFLHIPGGVVLSVVLSYVASYVVSPGSRSLLQSLALTTHERFVSPLARKLSEHQLSTNYFHMLRIKNKQLPKDQQVSRNVSKLQAQNAVSEHIFLEENAAVIQSHVDDVRHDSHIRSMYKDAMRETDLPPHERERIRYQAAMHTLQNYFTRMQEQDPKFFEYLKEKYLQSGNPTKSLPFLAYRDIKRYEGRLVNTKRGQEILAQYAPFLKMAVLGTVIGAMSQAEIQNLFWLAYDLTKSISNSVAALTLLSSLFYRDVVSRGLSAYRLAKRDVLAKRQQIANSK